MNEKENTDRLQLILSSVFSDETADYRTPVEPDEGDTVTVRIRVLTGTADRVCFKLGESVPPLLMAKCPDEGYFDYFETSFICPDREVCYSFEIETGYGTVFYDRTGARTGCLQIRPFRFMPGFHVPQWAKGALQYQIFTDRFCNGSPDNDVTDNEYYYAVGHSRHITDWNALPDATDIRNFYGGDLQGIASKLDYLQSLGVEVLYLNPVFVSPSSHKYDTQDYEHIDPHLSVISEDMEHSMESWEKHNGFAPKYIKRTVLQSNLESADAYFAWFCNELHSRGMRIILDGVFNHCGSFSKWMDREGIYLNKPGCEKGAYQSTDSPYRDYFLWYDESNPRPASLPGDDGTNPGYEGWWGYSTLPKLNYEGSEGLKEKIISIAEKWAKPPYSIDGWRLDVAADLGHSTEYNHSFWKEFRARLKAVNPEILIIAEHYGDPSDWLRGDEWDTVMNYDAFMDPVSYFFTGMEKHSDSRDDGKYTNAKEFFRTALEKSSAMDYQSLLCAMNELSNHDHSRFLTRTNRTVGRSGTVGAGAAGDGIDKAVFRQAAMLQMTWPGAPTVYYGDEAGQVGWTDPDNRRTYPWGREDRELIEYHRVLSRLRSENPVLRDGSFKPMYSDRGVAAFARFNRDRRIIAVFSTSQEEQTVTVRVADIGAADGAVYSSLLHSDSERFSERSGARLYVADGSITLTLKPRSSEVLAEEY